MPFLQKETDCISWFEDVSFAFTHSKQSMQENHKVKSGLKSLGVLGIVCQFVPALAQICDRRLVRRLHATW